MRQTAIFVLAFFICSPLTLTEATETDQKILRGSDVPESWNGIWQKNLLTVPEKTDFTRTTSSYEIQEFGNMSQRNSPYMLFEQIGFGKPMDPAAYPKPRLLSAPTAFGPIAVSASIAHPDADWLPTAASRISGAAGAAVGPSIRHYICPDRSWNSLILSLKVSRLLKRPAVSRFA